MAIIKKKATRFVVSYTLDNLFRPNILPFMPKFILLWRVKQINAKKKKKNMREYVSVQVTPRCINDKNVLHVLFFVSLLLFLTAFLSGSRVVNGAFGF